jgi:divalent metal cation (Fe/Co/Zn/Cd) transporter
MIPEQFHGLPVHPLAVHAAVVFVPLATLLAILFVIPRTRAWAAIPMALVSVAALVSVYVARASGFNFKTHLSEVSGGASAFNSSVLGQAILTHQGRANVLFYMMIVFAVIAVAVYFLYRDVDRFVGPVQYVACGVLVVAALVVAFQTYRVGESGSKAVYNPDGNQSFTTTARIGQLR